MLTGAELRESVRARHRCERRMLAVLDDDPTGSQSVRGVQVVTTFDPESYEAAFETDSPACFILTNSRGLPEPAAVELNSRIAADLFALADRLGRPLDLVSRGDSTLRGHVLAELRALDDARRAATGSGHDVLLIAPAFFEAGRTTVGDIHLVRVDGVDVPAGETEYARDATFGYSSSNLRDFVAEKSGGTLEAADVLSISLDTIHEGPEAIADLLAPLSGGRLVVVNAQTPEDYDVVALGVALARERGTTVLVRAAPSFVRALAGIEPAEPLTAAGIWAGGRRDGHGLIVVGSHVSGTSAQVARLQQTTTLASFELDVTRVLDDAYVSALGDAVVDALATGTVLVATSRQLVQGADAASSLEIARTVSASLTAVAARALDAKPAWVIAKGGITSHEVAVEAFGIRRAEVVGQLGRGIISLLLPIDAAPAATGMPYVVFAGNVGSESSLAEVVATLG